MMFRDREQAAYLLAEKLEVYAKSRPVVLGVPRGAVPMAKIIADRLHGELELILVHKFALKEHPEYAMGSVTEDGEIYLGSGAERLGLRELDVEEAASIAIAKLQAKRRLYTPHRRSIGLGGRTVILVDDGIATGATMTAAIRAANDAGAKRVIVATPVASNEAVQRLTREGALVEVLYVPENFFAVSQFFDDFSEVDDNEVIRALAGEPPEVKLRIDGKILLGHLSVPESARGLVIFAHGSGSGRLSPRNQFVAGELNRGGFATLLVDLLDETESQSRSRVFDIDLLMRRLHSIEIWSRSESLISVLPIGFFGASTGAAAAIRAAILPESRVRAIVSRGGRPDLASSELPALRVPILLIVGGDDEPVVTWNRNAAARVGGRNEIAIVPHATHLFEEPGALEEVAELALAWFRNFLGEKSAAVRRDGLAES